MGGSNSSQAPWLFTLFSLLVLLSASAQAALIYIDRARLRHMIDEGTPRFRALGRLLNEPTSTFSTVLVVNTLALGGATLFGFELAASWWDVARGIAVAIGVIAALLLILLQFIGRVIAVARPEQVALLFLRPVEILTSILRPVLLVLVWIERSAGRLLGLSRATTTPAEAEERLRYLVEDNNDLEEGERDMIASVIELGEQPVREVMIPRVDVVAMPASVLVRTILDRIVESGHSRVPIYRDTIDNITGVIYAKDLLKHLRDGSLDVPAATLAREPFFVPETKKVDDLLQEMRRKRVHLAIVVDEYGGTAGLISIEDLIEEIVGEIQDEYDVEEAHIEQLNNAEAIFDARVSIRDVNDTLDLDIDDEDFDTLGGLLYHQLGRVPATGDEVRIPGGIVTVISTDGRRVKKVRVQRHPVTAGVPVEE